MSYSLQFINAIRFGNFYLNEIRVAMQWRTFKLPLTEDMIAKCFGDLTLLALIVLSNLWMIMKMYLMNLNDSGWMLLSIYLHLRTVHLSIITYFYWYIQHPDAWTTRTFTLYFPKYSNHPEHFHLILRCYSKRSCSITFRLIISSQVFLLETESFHYICLDVSSCRRFCLTMWLLSWLSSVVKTVKTHFKLSFIAQTQERIQELPIPH